MNTQLIHQQIHRLDRDVLLWGRLFDEWRRGRERTAQAADQRLDAIEVELARLEGRVTMSTRSGRCTTAKPGRSRPAPLCSTST